VLRSGRVKRETKETKVDVTISIDGTGRCKAKTPIHFLNHMLDVSTHLSEKPLHMLMYEIRDVVSYAKRLHNCACSKYPLMVCLTSTLKQKVTLGLMIITQMKI